DAPILNGQLAIEKFKHDNPSYKWAREGNNQTVLASELKEFLEWQGKTKIKITSLTITGDIDGAGVKLLATMLQHNDTLTQLNLEGAGIGNDGAKSLTDA